MGGQLTDDEGKPTLDDPSNVAGIELLKQINDAQGGFAKVKSFTDSFDTFGENNQFVADQVGAQVNAAVVPERALAVRRPDPDRGRAVQGRGRRAVLRRRRHGLRHPGGRQEPRRRVRLDDRRSRRDEAWMAAGEARAATREDDGGINTGLFTGSPGRRPGDPRAFVVETGNAGFDQVISTYYDVAGLRQVLRLLARRAGHPERAEQRRHAPRSSATRRPRRPWPTRRTAAMRAYDNATAG